MYKILFQSSNNSIFSLPYVCDKSLNPGFDLIFEMKILIFYLGVFLGVIFAKMFYFCSRKEGVYIARSVYTMYKSKDQGES